MIPCTQNGWTQLSITSLLVHYASIAVAGTGGAMNEVDIVTSPKATVGYPLLQGASGGGGNMVIGAPLQVHDMDLSDLYAYTTVANMSLAVYYETPGTVIPGNPGAVPGPGKYRTSPPSTLYQAPTATTPSPNPAPHGGGRPGPIPT